MIARRKPWHGLVDPRNDFVQWMALMTKEEIEAQPSYCSNAMVLDELDKIIEQGEAVNSPQLQEDNENEI